MVNLYATLHLLGLGGLAWFIYYLVKGLRTRIDTLSHTIEEQKQTIEAIRERAEETEKLTKTYKQAVSDFHEMGEKIDDRRNALIKEYEKAIYEEQKRGNKLLNVTLDLALKQKITSKEKEEILDLYQQAVIMSSHWKLKYLNLFFVPNTKMTLLWCSRNPTSRQEYHAEWQTAIPETSERETILGVLTSEQMLIEEEGILQITDAGNIVLKYFFPSGAL